MKKLPGVEAVDVSLTRAVTDIRFRPGNTVTLAQLREVIKNGGFKAGESQVTALGRLVDEKGRLTLDLAPAKAVLVLEPDPTNPAVFARARTLLLAPASVVELRGTIAEGETLRVKEMMPR